MQPAARNYRWKSLWRLVLAALVAGGCAQESYRYGDFSSTGEVAPEEVVVEHGGPHKRLDRLSDALTWPRRKLRPGLPDKRQISTETIARVTRYLERNDLRGVDVSVRDYRPAEQWRKLHASRVVSPLARYTVGSLSVVRYTLLPGRLFGRNHYNPYTDTLYVNSDAPALLLHEAAFAKNIRQRRLPGAYAVASHLPFLAGWSEMDGARELVAYAQAEKDWELEQASYREVYPKVGAETLGAASLLVPIWWGGPVLSLAGSAVGGVTGRAVLAKRTGEQIEAGEELVERDVLGRDRTNREVQQASFEESTKTPSRRRYVTPSVHQE